MSIHPSIVEWLREKVEDHRWVTIREPRSVAHRWRKVTGGRIMSAGLTASITPSVNFSLITDASGVDEAYLAAARNGVLTVLLSRSWSPILSCTVTLSAFETHDTESCYAAFFSVAEEATLQLLGLTPGHSHNIEW